MVYTLNKLKKIKHKGAFDPDLEPFNSVGGLLRSIRAPDKVTVFARLSARS